MNRLGVIDVPNHRSSHSVPVVRGGGIGPAIAIVLSLGVSVVLFPGPRRYILLLAAAAIASALLGWFEDRQGVPVRYRLGAQVLIGSCVSIAFALLFGVHWAWLPVLIFFFASYINVANFMDGINGISALHGAAVGAVYLLVGVYYHLPWMALGSVVLGTAFLGFLPANASGKVFLGDVGSYLLGGFIATLAIGTFSAGVPIVVIIAPLAIYLADTGFTLIKRITRGEKWSEAHRSHVFQKLSPEYFGHLTAALVVNVLSLGIGLYILLATVNSPSSIARLVVPALLVVLYLLSPVGLSVFRKRPSRQGRAE